MRRRNKGNGGDFPDDPNGGGGPSGPIPMSQGRFNDATRVAAPVGGGMNQTMVGGRGGPSLADAPTMMQQAVPIEDEFPDPYGVPAPQSGGYAGPGGYGTAPASGYGTSGYGGAPVPAQSTGYDADPPTQYTADDDPYAAYGAPQGAAAGGYGAADQPRYDEPTGMYRPEPGAYDDPPAQPGYDDGDYRTAGYGSEPEYPPATGGRGRGETSGAYPAGGGYGGAEQQPAGPGGYGSWGAPAGGNPPAGGYGQGAGGYGGGAAPAAGPYGGGGTQHGRPESDYGDQGGYDPRGTYGRPDAYDGGQPQYGGAGAQPPPAGGYGADQGGYGADPQPYGGQPGGAQQPGGGYYGADQGGGRHGGQPRQQPPAPDPNRPGQRRSNEWLDD
jgi:hypothetical protein